MLPTEHWRNQMNISEFIEYLEEVRAEHGDLDVKIDRDYYGFEEVSWDIEQVDHGRAMTLDEAIEHTTNAKGYDERIKLDIYQTTIGRYARGDVEYAYDGSNKRDTLILR